MIMIMIMIQLNLSADREDDIPGLLYEATLDRSDITSLLPLYDDYDDCITGIEKKKRRKAMLKRRFLKVSLQFQNKKDNKNKNNKDNKDNKKDENKKDNKKDNKDEKDKK